MANYEPPLMQIDVFMPCKDGNVTAHVINAMKQVLEFEQKTAKTSGNRYAVGKLKGKEAIHFSAKEIPAKGDFPAKIRLYINESKPQEERDNSGF